MGLLGRGVAASVVIIGMVSCLGQYSAPSAGPFKGFSNEAMRKHEPAITNWDIAGNLRLRYEVKERFAAPGIPGSIDFREKGADVSNAYLLSRLRVHAGLSETWWRAYVEGRSSMVAGDERYAYPNSPVVPGTARRRGSGPEADAIDLHQAFVTVGDTEVPLSLKVGRQELSYGEERLVGVNPWNNIGRTFDAVKMRYRNSWVSVDVFSSRVVIPEDGRFNVDNDYDWFSGVYANVSSIPKHSLDVYVLARNASPQAISAEPSPQETPLPSARDIYTFGFRLNSKPGELGGWDYSLESAGQLGDYRDFRLGAGSRRLDQRAWMLIAQGGYTFKNGSGKPRLGFEYSHGSGDSNPGDGKHETFDNLFATYHAYYGYMNFFSLENLQDVRAIFQIEPHPLMNLAIEGHGFWLADTHDNLYNVNGTPRGGVGTTAGNGYGINAGYSSFVGTELDAIAGWAVTRFAVLEVGYGHFFTGNYIRQSLSAVGSKDADWAYVQVSVSF